MVKKGVKKPHYIAGLGDGNIPEHFAEKARQHVRHRHVDTEEYPWESSYFSTARTHHRHDPWQLSFFALLTAMIFLSALFVHLLSENAQDPSTFKTTAHTRARRSKIRKKKTDEWNEDASDDNDPLLFSSGHHRTSTPEEIDATTAQYAGEQDSTPSLYFGQQQRLQQRQRKLSYSNSSAGNDFLTAATTGIQHRPYALNPIIPSFGPSVKPSASTDIKTPLPSYTEGTGNMPVESYVPPKLPGKAASAQILSAASSLSSFADVRAPPPPEDEASSLVATKDDEEMASPARARPIRNLHEQRSSIVLAKGSDDPEDATPVRGSSKPEIGAALDKTPLVCNIKTLVDPTSPEPPQYPFLPLLNNSQGRSGLLSSNDMAPPASINVDDLHLQLVASGNVQHWEAQVLSESDKLDQITFPEPPVQLPVRSNETSGDASLLNDDPRKSIHHKRYDLTHHTNSTASLQGAIKFSELDLREVIGGGGFGQVWKAKWRGTPVAVKVLTGSAQVKHVPKAVLEEFVAEINLLKGMRHPNICLYMGACLDPPNRAIITELAANGSLWDALRLPLNAPYTPCDGNSRDAWPLALYEPDSRYGAPPSAAPNAPPPLPPRGTWPWALVKRVACGSARGMAYLHSGSPPILHRDLKSANILLDDSYTPKVCDFGLSRLKAQERSMTGNCGTVQWMAPEVLANASYNETADVFSYGVIVWEMLSRQCPFDGMTPIQCALAVLNRDQRPDIPKWCPRPLHALIRSCFKKDPNERPTFSEILDLLDDMPCVNFSSRAGPAPHDS